MQAVILAGGLGTRLRPITEKIPKCMAPVGDKPFLFYLLKLLKERGVEQVVLCIGYLGEQIEDYFKNGRRFGIAIRYSQEKGSLLGTGGALKLAEDLLEKDFLVINGDTYLDDDYRKIYDAFIENDKESLVVAYPTEDADPGNLKIDKDLLVTKYGKEAKGLGYVDAGVLVLKRYVISGIESGNTVSLENELFPLLINRSQMAAFITKQKYYDIGTFAKLKCFENCLLRTV